MSAKKKITMGKYRDQVVTISKKKAKPEFSIVKLKDGREVQIHNQFLK